MAEDFLVLRRVVTD